VIPEPFREGGPHRGGSAIDRARCAVLDVRRVEAPSPVPLSESELTVGERVVYPNQGVCRISGVEVKEIGGVKGEFLTMRREEDGATVMVPRSKIASIGLRRVAAPEEVEAVFAMLTAEAGNPELDWKVRHRTHADKMTIGSLAGTAEVLKALHALSERRPLPQRERELYDAARHLLVSEVAVSLGMTVSTAEDTIDLCLTPPAGSARAAAKAKLIADRLAAEEAEELLSLGLEDGAGDEGLDEAPEEEAVEAESEEEEPAETKSGGRAAGKARKTEGSSAAKATKTKPRAAKKPSAAKTKAKHAAPKAKPAAKAKGKTKKAKGKTR
jgi:CarD family transcriptional regulator